MLPALWQALELRTVPMKRKTWFLFCILLPATLLAHDTWLLPTPFRAEPGKPVLLRLATSEAFPTSDAALDLDRVARFSIATASDKQELAGYKQDGKFLTGAFMPGAPGHAVVILETKPRLLVMKAAEFQDYLQHEELQQVITSRAASGKSQTTGRELYRKIAKTVVCVGDTRHDAAFAKANGLWLEIIPERSPCGLEAGDTISVQVLFAGKPLEGAHVAAGYGGTQGHDYAAWSATDKFGRTSIQFSKSGVWFLRVLHMVPLEGSAEADWQSAFATLTLEVLPVKTSGSEAEIKHMLQRQTDAWNRGDIEGFVNDYWKSGGLTFSGANGVTRGWSGLLERYRRSYPTLAAMGKLSFANLEIEMLATDAALVLGRWRLDREKDAPGGVFSLIVRKFPEGWRVMHDHTSSDQ